MNRQSLVRPIKGVVLSHSVPALAGVEMNSRGLAQFGDAVTLNFHPCLSPLGACNHKYAAHWKGALPQGRFLNEWQTVIPALQDVVIDPLWDVLETLSDKRRHTDSHALSLHLGSGYVFPNPAPVLMRRLCECPDWHNLGCVIAIMGSTDWRLRPQRRWCSLHFLIYLALICQGEPCCGARQPLYKLLDALHERHFFEPIVGWPHEFAGFEQLGDGLDQVAAVLRDLQCFERWDLSGCTAVHLLLSRAQPESSPTHWSQLARDVVPSVLLRQVANVLKRHQRNRFRLDVGV
ncbi:hypothetical protein [Pseudomonas urmiensis]|uniref:hypothetical protein n=1 Tax=Pseudomonas urmiensis TaxID=2745493 RepID=UPI003D098A6A